MDEPKANLNNGKRATVDLDLLKKETGLSLQGLADASGLKAVRNIYKWTYQNGGRPSYDAIVKLIELGASPEAIFGMPWPSRVVPIENGSDFEAGVREVVEKMKKEGRL